MEKSQYGNPNIFALGAFGFSLAMLGVEMTFAHEAAGGALYGVLFAGVLEFIGGMWLIAKGDSYLASIVALFGGWLIGFYMLMSQGRVLKVFNPVSVAWYMFCLLPPIVLLAIPAFKTKKVPLMGAFIGLLLLVFALGMGNIMGPAGKSTLVFAGYMSFVSMFFIWWLMAENIFHGH